jgi:hypothetical protein
MKTLIAAVALAVGLIAVPAFIQSAAAVSLHAVIVGGKNIGPVPDASAQYCVPPDDGLTAHRIFCRAEPG